VSGAGTTDRMDTERLSATSRKTYEQLTGDTVPHDLEWTRFVRMWQDLGDDVEESGGKLVVHLDGHRRVFHGGTDARVSTADVDAARDLLQASPPATGSGSLVAVAIDAHAAKILTFDLTAPGTDATTRTVPDREPTGRHPRTVERHTGRDENSDLDSWFDQVAEALLPVSRAGFVVLGHGKGEANTAVAFVERLRHRHAALAGRLRGTGTAQLSGATDAQLEDAARHAIGH
jgi:hypothetical protein